MVHRQYEVGTFKHKLFTLGQQWIDGLLIILILVEFSNSSNNCGPGIYSPGSKDMNRFSLLSYIESYSKLNNLR